MGTESIVVVGSPAGLMEREKFAELVGVSVDTVTAWIKRGYIPSVPVGKYRLVNLVKLHTELASGEFDMPMGEG